MQRTSDIMPWCAMTCMTAPSRTHLWHHVLKTVHDPRALGFLVVGEDARDDDDARQDDA